MATAAKFQLFGFPVHVRSGFLVFLILVVMLQGAEFGIPFAIFIALFTLLHELGHAVAARRTGARAQISLDFMAGYAAYTPTRPLTRFERLVISFAGPGVQVLVGGVVYLVIRRGFALPEYGHAVQHAVFWAGVAIGALNLLPLLPFDGGHITQIGVEVLTRDPARAHKVMQWFTLVVTISAIVYMSLSDDLGRFAVFAVIPLLSVLAGMSGERQQLRRDRNQKALSRAEAMAWATGQVDFPEGSVPSPWFRAWQQLQHGDQAAAVHVMLFDLADTEPVNWWPPDGAPLDALRAVLEAMPGEIPVGRPYSSYVMSGVLLRLGRYDQAARYAAQAYNTGHSPMLAVHVARGAAAVGHTHTALAWLRTAAETSPQVVATALAEASELQPLRSEPELAPYLD